MPLRLDRIWKTIFFYFCCCCWRWWWWLPFFFFFTPSPQRTDEPTRARRAQTAQGKTTNLPPPPPPSSAPNRPKIVRRTQIAPGKATRTRLVCVTYPLTFHRVTVRYVRTTASRQTASATDPVDQSDSKSLGYRKKSLSPFLIGRTLASWT